METIPCIFGHGYSSDVAITDNGFTGRRCPECATIYVSPRPDRAAIFDLYHHDNAWLPAAYHLGFNPVAELSARRHVAAIFDRSPFKLAGARRQSLLEIGCGAGYVLRIAKSRGVDAYGVELNPYQAEYVDQGLGIPCETMPFTAASFGEKRFDVIFHCDVLSHFPDPIRDLSAMREKLSSRGYLVFETGNAADIDPRYYKFIPAWQYPDHLFFFGESSLRELLKRAGYSEVHIASWSILPQLALRRCVQRLRPATRAAGVKPASSSTLSARQKAVRVAIAHAQDFVRYGLGARLSNPRHPRTVMVWARK